MPNRTIDDYLSGASEDQRTVLEQLRRTIHAAAPRAEECISYGLPAFRLDGKPLVAFGAAKHHCSFYPMSAATIAAHQDDLKAYETSKGTIRFSVESPLPARLVRKLVKARIAENRAPTRSASAKMHVEYHKDGTPWAKGRMKGDVPTGYWEWFRKDGTKLRSGHFEDGRQVGEWTTYDREGRVYKVTHFKAEAKAGSGRKRKAAQ